ncbi:MAG: LPS export ABC transporter permease LptF [Steroidobacteraceae bacterium]
MVRGIFFRHVLRDVGGATLGVGAVLLVLLLTNQLAFILGRAATGQIPATLVLELVRLSLVENSVVILPIAVLLGGVLGLGRLYHDSEIAAAQACGVGTGLLYRAMGVITVVATGLAAWVAFQAGPAAAQRTAQIRIEALRTAATRGLVPGQFRSLGSDTTLYFGGIDPDGQLREVFVQRSASGQDSPGSVEIVLADHARYEVSADSNFYTITLQNGESLTGVPGQGQWRRMRFATQTVRLPTPEATLPNKPLVDMQPTANLLHASDPRLKSELHWRIASVLLTAVLGLLAVPLARLRPRQGRYGRVVWALLLYAVYAYFLIYGRTLLERQRIPAWLGLWWAHLIAIGLGLLFIALPLLRDRWGRWRARPA